MSKDTVVSFQEPETIEDPLTELLRNGSINKESIKKLGVFDQPPNLQRISFNCVFPELYYDDG
jgi:hypothetical protein